MRARRVIGVVGIAAVCVSGGVITGAAGAPATGLTAFTCAAPTEFVSEGYNPMTLSEATYGAGAVTYTPVGTSSEDYNALAFNPADNFLYAIDEGNETSGPGATGDLVRISADGSTSDLGAITVSGQGTLGSQQDNGTFDSAGDFDVYEEDALDMFRVNVETNVATDVPLSPHTALAISDWSAIGTSLWAISDRGSASDVLYRVDPATGDVTQINAALGIPPTADYGSAWTDGAGDLVVVDESTGNVDTIKITDPDGSHPGAQLVSSYTGRSTTKADGAACVAGDAALRLSAKPPAAGSAGGTVSETFTVASLGPSVSSGYTLDVSLPSGLTREDSASTLAKAGCTISLHCAQGGLAVNSTRSLTLHLRLPHVYGKCYSTVATVIPNEAEPATAKKTVSIKTCVAKRHERPHLTLRSTRRGHVVARVTTAPKLKHDKVTFVVVKHGHTHRLGTARTAHNGVASKTFAATPGTTVKIEATVAATSQTTAGTTKHRAIKVHR